MPIIRLEQLDDPRLEPFRHLKHPRRDLHRQFFVVEGMLLVERLIQSRFPVASLLAVERIAPELGQISPPDVPLYVVPDGALNDLVGFRFHRGVLGCGRRLPNPEPSALGASEPTSMIVACPWIQDPENLGNILRSTAALGGTGVLVGRSCPDVLSRRVLRVSMGASLRLPVRVSPSFLEDLRWLAEEADYEVWGTVLDDRAIPLSGMIRPPKLVVVLGREDQGLSEEVLQVCHRRVTIPMAPGTDSLNVAMAVTILLYVLRGSSPPWPQNAGDRLGSSAIGTDNDKV